MADESTDLAVIDIKPEQAPVLYVPNGLEGYLNHIRELAKEVPDVTTKKGRDRIGSLARSVGVSKKAIENPGRAYLKQLKELVKPAEEELKRFVDACDDISKSILKPRVEWDAEQERLKLEAERIAAEEAYAVMWQEAHEMDARLIVERAEKLAAEIEVAHEMALLMNDALDRAQADKKAEDERLQKEHDDRIAAEAVAKVKRDADLAAEQAERDRVALAVKAEQDKKDAIAKAEREKQEAISAEQRKAQEEADRIKREAQQKEDARLAEEKRIADEAAARAANEAHRKTVGTAVVNGLIEHAGLTREQAIATLCAIKDSKIPHTNIHY
ncbi:hypothetical protein ACIUVW_003963 [Yersinia enterocolitica]|nr:hypothetical protein [Yersinia enterocolitica]EKN3834212.1 hypothetical protein [Yersinia enterocolitica]ELI8163672.1 hypothetical protein [Yersinia enterocolitica]ELI8318038.1 hypothetical protein [Yersinia enterocolitica]ELI8322291.1 hypothetical protein [Yersinia enterocolitica]